LVLRTAGVFILNQDLGPQAAKLNHSFVELNRLAGEGLRELISFPFSWKRYRHLKVIHRELKKIMALPTQEGRISLSERLRAQGMPERFIRDQVKAFMFAGYDTTASSLIFAMDAITRERSVQDKIYLENREHFRQAHYTQAVYKESLRLYPSAYFLPREIKNDDNILGQSVRAGAQIFLSVKHIQRDSSVFKNPDQFIPERFLDKLPHSHAFIPFGGGARICIGAQLAMLEATVVLQRLCERYIFHSVRSSPPEIEGLITAHTKTPLLVKLSRRKSC
jgi:cytochrome P450